MSEFPTRPEGPEWSVGGVLYAPSKVVLPGMSASLSGGVLTLTPTGTGGGTSFQLGTANPSTYSWADASGLAECRIAGANQLTAGTAAPVVQVLGGKGGPSNGGQAGIGAYVNIIAGNGGDIDGGGTGQIGGDATLKGGRPTAGSGLRGGTTLAQGGDGAAQVLGVGGGPGGHLQLNGGNSFDGTAGGAVEMGFVSTTQIIFGGSSAVDLVANGQFASNLTFKPGAAYTIYVNTEAASTVGDNLTVKAGTGGSGATGGATNLQGGDGGSGAGGNGGALNLYGGAIGGGSTYGAVNVGPSATNAVNLGAAGTVPVAINGYITSSVILASTGGNHQIWGVSTVAPGSGAGEQFIAQGMTGAAGAAGGLVVLQGGQGGTGSGGTPGNLELLGGPRNAGANNTFGGSVYVEGSTGSSRGNSGNVRIGTGQVGTTAAVYICDSGASLSFFGAGAVVQQTRGATLTNNVTVGGSNDVIADFSDLTTYSNSAAAIRNNLYQLARAVRMHDVALRAYGLET